ncbi:hypothetical protein MLIT_49020 [Mycolicibacterium litorale]|uniref:Uncharacterized protein n=1 Tax=Mycolicibacterium litorale TaxID=758802 RepID=A0AAD1IPU4_9MYCO|nr:hypothetical protein MLIT_49020 [Mycolicibacterium litorale]
MTGALLVASTLAVIALSAAGFAWRRRRARHQSAYERYRRAVPYLLSDRQMLREKRLARARRRQRFWAAGSAGAVGGYYSDGGIPSDGDGGGCGGGGCGGGGCGGGGCGGGGS